MEFTQPFIVGQIVLKGSYVYQTLSNIFPILGWFFVSNAVTIFARLTTKQNVMKKAKYLIFDRLERNCFEKW